MFSNLFRRKSEYGKHTDIYPNPPIVPGDQSWMEYKQLTNDQNAFITVYGAASRKAESQKQAIESKLKIGQQQLSRQSSLTVTSESTLESPRSGNWSPQHLNDLQQKSQSLREVDLDYGSI